MPEFIRPELRRLAAGLREFVNFQQRLGLHLLEKPVPPARAKQAPADDALVTQTLLSLEEIRLEMGDCRRCPLWEARTQLVFGAGNPRARLMFIGEAPGAEEDKRGEPFVGKAGELLDNLFLKLGLSRQEVYITNAVKSRPPKNRTPAAAEISACRPFLLQQIQAVGPEIIVTLGAVPTWTLLKLPEPISRLRGSWRQWQGIAVMPTFHPAYLVRLPQERIKTWNDMQQVMAVYRSEKG